MSLFDRQLHTLRLNRVFDSELGRHISVAAASYQVHRVAAARSPSDEAVKDLVNQYAEGRQIGFLGEPRVNVLELNLALDGLK